MTQPFTVKHRPKSLGEVVGNNKAKQSFLRWLQEWGMGGKKAALLYGPAGMGKTVTVEAAARDLDMDVVEINASDKRTGTLLERLLGMAATQGSLFGKRRLILLDEVDGINLREDRGAVQAIVKMIRESRVPIALTANDPWDPKIAPLRSECDMIQFRRLSRREILPYLRKLCQAEGIAVGDEALTLLVEKNRGDLRAILNDLEVLASEKKAFGVDEILVLGDRDKSVSVFEALTALFNSKDYYTSKKAVGSVDIDYEMLFEWIYENTPRRIDDPKALAEAMEALAKARFYLTRAKKNQAWSLLPYMFDMMTAGVALSQTGGRPSFTRLRFPERIRHLSQTRVKRALIEGLCRRVSERCHISASKARVEYLPYLRFIFVKSPVMADRLAAYLELTEGEAEYLRAP